MKIASPGTIQTILAMVHAMISRDRWDCARYRYTDILYSLVSAFGVSLGRTIPYDNQETSPVKIRVNTITLTNNYH